MTLTPKNLRRAAQLERQKIDKHKKKSKGRGDYHFLAYQNLTGDGDYIQGVDEGEPPQGAQW